MKRLEVAFKGIIRNKGRILILKRSTHQKVAPGQWDTPGGKLRFGETVEAALEREIYEEIGLKTIKIERVLNVWSIMKNRETQLIGITFICSYRGGKIVLSGEHSEFKWVDPKVFVNMIIVEKDLKRTLQVYIKECLGNPVKRWTHLLDT